MIAFNFTQDEFEPGKAQYPTPNFFDWFLSGYSNYMSKKISSKINQNLLKFINQMFSLWERKVEASKEAEKVSNSSNHGFNESDLSSPRNLHNLMTHRGFSVIRFD